MTLKCKYSSSRPTNQAPYLLLRRLPEHWHKCSAKLEFFVDTWKWNWLTLQGCRVSFCRNNTNYRHVKFLPPKKVLIAKTHEPNPNNSTHAILWSEFDLSAAPKIHLPTCHHCRTCHQTSCDHICFQRCFPQIQEQSAGVLPMKAAGLRWNTKGCELSMTFGRF